MTEEKAKEQKTKVKSARGKKHFVADIISDAVQAGSSVEFGDGYVEMDGGDFTVCMLNV